MTSLPELRLKKNEDRRVRAGHAWIYSNEVDIRQTPIKDLVAGQFCHITNFKGNVLGTAYVNPGTLICARVISRKANQVLTPEVLIHRIRSALAIRDACFAEPCYRLIYSESDNLPGLVVDRFNDVLSVQVTTAGMDAIQDDILDALVKVLKPVSILLRNDSSSRQLEGLEMYTRVAMGNLPEQIELRENNTRFVTSLAEGQKTGWFYDHRMNRQRMQQYVQGKRVLDVFSYIGAWGIQALSAGAKEVTCVDSSARALDLAAESAALNLRGQDFTAIEGDAFAALKSLSELKQDFDVVVVDPPAFVKRRKDLKAGSLAYRRINQLALSLIKQEGILVSASCSYHMPREQLLNEIRQAANASGTALRVLEQGHQGADHPVHPAMKETDYLKSYICHVRR